MSAICWVYGRMIHQALGGRPIGLIATNWCSEYHVALVLFIFLIIFFRNEDMTVQSYDELSIAVPLNHSNLFNSMIYPFTRLVIYYGTIWYQGKK